MEFNINELMTALETTDRNTLLKTFNDALVEAERNRTKTQEKKEDAVEMFCAITKYLHRWHPELGDMTMNDRDIDMAMEFIDNMAPDMAKLMKPLNVKVDPIKDFLNAFGLA